MRPQARTEPRSTVSFALALAVHALLIAVLFFAISWKTRPPAPVVAELWTPPPPKAAPRPEPPKPAPVPEPKVEPKVEPKPPPKVDIALEREKEMKRLEELERKRREDERKRKELEQKQLEEKKRKEEEAARRLEAERKRKEEEARAKAEREKQRVAEEERLKRELDELRQRRTNEQLARDLASAPAAARSGVPVPGDPGATNEYRARIAAKIRGNVVLPPEFAGNPEAEFEVQQLPSGDIVSARLARSSGNRQLDAAWERAILKSSPLPLPTNRDVFQATLRLKFRPVEER